MNTFLAVLSSLKIVFLLQTVTNNEVMTGSARIIEIDSTSARLKSEAKITHCGCVYQFQQQFYTLGCHKETSLNKTHSHKTRYGQDLL